MKPSTIIDIAEAANCGKTTVSDVLRKKPGYSSETRRRILEAARNLGYRPHYHASALRGGKTMALGILGADPHGSASQAIVRGVEIAARQHGYVTYSVEWGHEDRNRVIRHVEELLHRSVDGIIYYSPVIGPPTQPVGVLAKAGIPVVYIGWAPINAAYVVHIDRQSAINEMARHLAALGHRDAVLVSSQYDQENPDLKINAYRQAFSYVGLNLDTSERWMLPHGSDYATNVFQLIGRRIRSGELPPVLLMGGDFEAAQAIAACHDGGVQVPTDVSIIGFDDQFIAAMLRPSLSTIHQPREEVGEAAFRVLEQALLDRVAPAEPPSFSCRFIPRQSTGPPHQ